MIEVSEPGMELRCLFVLPGYVDSFLPELIRYKFETTVSFLFKRAVLCDFSKISDICSLLLLPRTRRASGVK